MYPEHVESLEEAAALPMQKRCLKKMNPTKMSRKYHLSCESVLTAGHCMLLSTPSVFECDVRRWLDAPWPSDKITGKKWVFFRNDRASTYLMGGSFIYDLLKTLRYSSKLTAFSSFLEATPQLDIPSTESAFMTFRGVSLGYIRQLLSSRIGRWQTLISIASSSIWLYTAGLEGRCWYEGLLLLWTWQTT